MSNIRCENRWIKHAVAAFAAAAAVSMISPPNPAQAQGFFESIFGGFDRGMRRSMPPRASAYSHHEPSYSRERPRERRSSSGPSSGFCVRTCDGRFFPVKAAGGVSAAELCKSFCPAAQTKIFSGSKIDYSVAPDGQRYAELDNAFLYRERMVQNCSCNGKDPYGLVSLKAENDPTLKAGDVVATNDGLVTYSGKKSGELAFTPIEESDWSKQWRLRLMSIKVAPAPPREEAAVKPVEEEPSVRRDRRSAQR